MSKPIKLNWTEDTSPLIGADWLDKAVGLLALAKQHNIRLAVNGDKIRMSRPSSVDPLIVEILASNKADLIDIMGMPEAIKLWLGGFQTKLADKYGALTDGIDRWEWGEGVYHDLFPDDSGCVCDRGHCIDTAIVTCNACVKKNQIKKGT